MLAITTSMLLILLTSYNMKFYWAILSSWLFTLSFMLSMSFPTHNFLFSSYSSSLFMDYVSFPVTFLTLWISALMIMSSYKIYISKDKPKLFIITVYMLLLILTLCFSSKSIFLFYILFEASLIPTIFLIILWGSQPERLQASFYFMMYTIMASLPLLLGIIILYKFNSSLLMTNMLWNIPETISYKMNMMWWLMMLGAFLVKLPMFMTHLWLPKAHVEAPVAGSMILAAILLKLGSYGALRMTFIFPFFTLTLWPVLSTISMFGAVITAMICLRQPDMKSLIAYSSVGHMGLLLSGLASASYWGLNGALAMTIAHGLSSSAMFSSANMMYETTNTRSLFLIKGLISISPTMALFFFITMAANMAAPPSINLFSEIILFTSILAMSNFMCLLIVFASFFAGAYSYILFTSTQHGTLASYISPMKMLNSRNILISLTHLIPLILLIMTPCLLMFI